MADWPCRTDRQRRGGGYAYSYGWVGIAAQGSQCICWTHHVSLPPYQSFLTPPARGHPERSIGPGRGDSHLGIMNTATLVSKASTRVRERIRPTHQTQARKQSS